MRKIMLAFVIVIAVPLIAAGCSSKSGNSNKDKDTKTAEKRLKNDTASSFTASLKADLQKVGQPKDAVGIPVPGRATCTKSIPASCKTELVCPPSSDADERDEKLCAWLEREDGGRLAFAQDVSGDDQACTMQYGGGATAHVTGVIEDESIDVKFSLENGCEIARWNQASPLWTGELNEKMEPEVISDPPEAFRK